MGILLSWSSLCSTLYFSLILVVHVSLLLILFNIYLLLLITPLFSFFRLHLTSTDIERRKRGVQVLVTGLHRFRLRTFAEKQRAFILFVRCKLIRQSILLSTSYH